MGADLYIEPLFEPNYEKWEGLFEEAAAKCHASEPGSTDYEIWQRKVDECYERMYGEGYFRDPYNLASLLWQFGLSWWEDILPMVGDEQILTVEKVEEFLALLQDHEAGFERNLAHLGVEEQRYFRDRYTELQVFLAAAIKFNCPVSCSI